MTLVVESYTNANGGRNLTADEALTALQNLTIDTRIGTRYLRWIKPSRPIPAKF